MGLLAVGLAVDAWRGGAGEVLGRPWFLGLSGVFAVHLLSCMIRRLPATVRRLRASVRSFPSGSGRAFAALAPDTVHAGVLLLLLAIWISGSGLSGTLRIGMDDVGTIMPLGETGVEVVIGEVHSIGGAWSIDFESSNGGGTDRVRVSSGQGASIRGVGLIPAAAGLDPAGAVLDAAWAVGSGQDAEALTLRRGDRVDLSGSDWAMVLDHVAPAVSVDHGSDGLGVEPPVAVIRILATGGADTDERVHVMVLDGETQRIEIGNGVLRLFGVRLPFFAEVRYDTSPETPWLWSGFVVLSAGICLALFPRVADQLARATGKGGTW